MQLNRGEKKVKNFSYNLSAKIGEGSFSRVYIGKNDLTNENVAIKVITMDSLKTSTILDLLQNEVHVMKQMNHENIVKLHEVFNTRNNVYMVEEFCEGGDVGNILKEKGTLLETLAFQILKDILKGFKELMRHGIIHRDLKPANIFISKGLYKLGDFGFAKPVRNIHEKMVTKFIGTPLYMSPQCLQNVAYSSKCDIWSIGITYYQLLTGATPWRCNNHYELLNKIFTERISLSPNFIISDWSKNFLMSTIVIDEESRVSWDQIFMDPLLQERKPEIIEIHSDESQSTNSEEKVQIIQNVQNLHNTNNLFANKFLLHLNNILNSFEQVKGIHCLSQWLYEKLFFLATKHKCYLLQVIKYTTINGEFDLGNSLNSLVEMISEIQESKNYDLLAFDDKFFQHFNDELANEKEFLNSLQHYLMMAIRQCNHYITLSFSSGNKNDTKIELLLHLLRNLTNYYQALTLQEHNSEKADSQKLSKIFSSSVPSNSMESFQKLREKIYILNI